MKRPGKCRHAAPTTLRTRLQEKAGMFEDEHPEFSRDWLPAMGLEVFAGIRLWCRDRAGIMS